jgi:hypothetical protein
VTIKDILGHAHLKTLEAYVQADLEMKRRAIAKVKPVAHRRSSSWRRNPSVLEWLENL